MNRGLVLVLFDRVLAYCDATFMARRNMISGHIDESPDLFPQKEANYSRRIFV